ncbi:MAG: LacI family transcriptional regulator, partial [Spirochaetes bacterium]
MRIAGCLDAVEQAGISIDENHNLTCSCSCEGGYLVAGDNLEYLGTLDGIFVPADITAFGFLNALREEGLRVPQDLKVI